MPEPLDYESPKPSSDEPRPPDRIYTPVAGCFGVLAAVFAGVVLWTAGIGWLTMIRHGNWRDGDTFGLIVFSYIGLTFAYFAFRWIRDARF